MAVKRRRFIRFHFIVPHHGMIVVRLPYTF
jgi:hypothetical protein